jgi:hypothetical protein
MCNWRASPSRRRRIGDPERVLRLQHDMLDRLATIPGVTDVSFTGNVPMAGNEAAPASTTSEMCRSAT